MLKNKGYAIAIAAVVGGLTTAATVFPQYAVIFGGLATVLTPFIGQMAHNAQPPEKKS